MTRIIPNELLQRKLAESIAVPLQQLTPRDISLPGIAGKVLAVIGVRRGGKTSFLRRQIAERVATGQPRDSHLLVSLEDERLVGITAADLGWLLDEHLRVVPAARTTGARTIYLDEVQVVPGWETLVRRLVETSGTEVFVSGSSAKLLSREVATSLRGRAMEVLVHPFSFREVLRHAKKEPTVPWSHLGAPERADLDAALRDYLAVGGFPEAQGARRRDRISLLNGYVDVMVLRDVVERHGVTNPHALRWLQRHLLATPGGAFSVTKLHRDLKSQTITVGRETLYEYLAHMEDAFLLRVISMHSASERQRMVNPRKAYPIDPGLIPLYERDGRAHRGRALETGVLIELERRGYTVDWLRVGNDFEVDFFAQRTGDQPLLIQVCLDTTADATWEREIRSLAVASSEHPTARALLISLDSAPPDRILPNPLEWRAASDWLLDPDW